MKAYTLAIVLLALAWVYTSDQDMRELEREQQRYNEMRQLHSQSAGKYGWPAYDDLKERVYLESRHD